MPRATSLSVCLVVLSVLLPVHINCQLSQNSGINSSDTWVVVDLTITSNTQMNLPASYYNPSTNTTSNVLSTAPTYKFHVESGYDSSGGLVMNMFPSSGSLIDPYSSDTSGIGLVRMAGGQITIFSQNLTPISLVMPTGVPNTWPLSILGANPGPSALSNLVVPNVPNYANAMHAQYQTRSPSGYTVTSMQSNGTAVWTYVPSGSNYIAQQLVLTPSISNGTTTRTVTFSNLSWYDNPSNDSARAAKGYTAKAPPAATTSTPSGLTAASQQSCSTTVSKLGGTQNIAFVHGLASNCSTWGRMTPWLNQDFRFGTEITPTLSWSSSLASQGTALVDEINSVGGSNYILVGHSQGGLVSRSAAQYYQSQNVVPPPVQGVVTVDTPHQGAVIADTGGVAIDYVMTSAATWLWNWAGCNSPYDNFVCFFAAVIYVGAPVVEGMFYSYADITDLMPGSSYLNQLNSFSEKFTQAGIVSNTPLWFDETRIFWNALFLRAGCYPETGCGERNIAAITQGIFLEILFADIFCILEEIFDYENADYWAAEAEFLTGILAGMETVDVFWNEIVSGFLPSDAIVPVGSQNYPYSSAVQYPISPADSHTGATTSPNVHNELYATLSGPQFRVPTQASCSFSASPSSDAVSPSAASYSFGFTTGAGCQWSAVSNAPWLSVTSASGTSSGNIGFSVAANPVPIPRTGVIQTGNGSTSAAFSVTQAGVCTYSLSESQIAIQPGGGNYTVSVYTQNNCVWSAVSNSSWLSISAGASGTGPGSFTLSASPNSTDTDLIGTITVMNQALTVTLGDPIGAPGSGSVSFSGSPQTVTINPCQNNQAPAPNYCPYTVPNGGTIYVNVGGLTFSVGYGSSTDTAASLASTIAGQMNYTDSPITATVSGSKVTIKSSINGAATNYSLSTSYTYNTQYFSSPAFTATPSGSTLTGGIN